MPAPATTDRGNGARRAVVFGGGGEYFVAWLVGFLHQLHRSGISLGDADLIVGTSAGSLVGSIVAGGHLERAYLEIEGSSHLPSLLAAMAGSSEITPSQDRARQAMRSARGADAATIQEIGRAAMASHNADLGELKRLLGIVLSHAAWASPALHTTCVDCFTGELVIVGAHDGVPNIDAVAASAALPGFFGPVWIGDRLCMDGGMGSTLTNATVATGAERVLILAAIDSEAPQSVERGLGNTLNEEIATLRAAGGQVEMIAANPDPSVKTMDASTMTDALRAGQAAAVAAHNRLASFWI